MTTQTAPQITAAEDPVRTLAFTSYLRVVAIVAVVLIHVSGSTYVLKGARGSSAWWVASVLTFSTKWAVPVFVMVSGTLLLKPPANRSASLFYRRRLSRIGIPLLVWHAVYVSLVMFVIAPDLKRGIVMANLLRGEAYTALYFFWLILGLYVVTPLLWPLVESATRRQLVVIGAGLTALPALDLVTRNVIGRLRDNPLPLGEPTLFTQFVPYVGFFILGYALRSVIVRGWALAALGVGVLLLAAEITAQVTLLGRLPKPWPLHVNTFIPVNYQGWLLGLCAIGLFIWVRSATRPGTRAATPETARRARALGDLTFGVFACHLLVLFLLKRLVGMGTGEAPDTVLGLLGLNAAVVVVSFIVAKVFLSLPVLRRTMCGRLYGVGMRVLVSGGAGYIGSHTVVQLVAAGHEVVIVDSFANAKPTVINRLEALTGTHLPVHGFDLRDEDKTQHLFAHEKIDAVIHFAGLKAVGESVEKPLEYYENNLGATFSLVRAMRRHHVDKLVFSSSATVYGANAAVPMREEMPTSATNPYGWTKVMIEQVLRDVAAAEPHWRIALLRYFNPVGAHPSGTIGEDPQGIPNNLMPFIAQVAVGKLEKLRVFGDDYDTPDGTAVRDYIHVEDLAAGHLAALNRLLTTDHPVSTWNLGTGHGTSVFEVLHAFERACGHELPYEVVGRRPGDIAASYADPSRAEAELGWRAEKTIDDMCADQWHWQRNNPLGYPD